jgi:hypothetical protein
MPQEVDRILEKLAKDVEAAVHALYRGEVRQATAKARTGHLLTSARTALADAIAGTAAPAPNQSLRPATPVASSPRPSVAAPMVAGGALGWDKAEGDAVLRCITAWLPMGGPASTPADTKCIPAGKMLVPTWGEREQAREAVRRVTQP